MAARQLQRIGLLGLFGQFDPACQPRQACFFVQARRKLLPVEHQLAAFAAVGEFPGLRQALRMAGHGAPGQPPDRITGAVGAQVAEIVAAMLVLLGMAGGVMGLGQGAGRVLGGRPGQHASGRIPQRPDPPQAQREVGGEPQQRGRLPAALLGLQRHRHHLLGLGGNVHFLRLGVASRVQADGVACQPGGIQEAQVEFCRLAGVHRIAPARSQH